MKIRLGYVSNSSSSSFIVSPEEAARILREERLKKLNNLKKIIDNEKNVVSLHDEIFKKSK
jgi:hypothetical protein